MALLRNPVISRTPLIPGGASALLYAFQFVVRHFVRILFFASVSPQSLGLVGRFAQQSLTDAGAIQRRDEYQTSQERPRKTGGFRA